LAKWIQAEADQAGFAHVVPLAALTQGLQGLQPSPMASLKAAGCAGVSDAGSTIVNTALRRRFFEYAATFDITVHLTPVEYWLAQGGYIHEGNVSTRLGLTGIPVTAETIAIARDLLLIEQTGVKAHFARLSSAAGVSLIAAAQQRGLPVTADVAAHQLHLTEIDVSTFDSNCYVLPPLRSEQDRIGLIQGLVEGTITAICSDHQPHDADAKLAPLSDSEPGISALETLLPLTLRLTQKPGVNLSQAISWITQQPAKILGIPAGTLTVNAAADVCIFDPNRIYQLNHIGITSRGHNTPFGQWDLQGLVTHTICAGKLVFSR
jgi:dihydroorotase